MIATGVGGTVTFTSGHHRGYDGATSLLDAGENAGMLMPSGCRMGVCFGCVVPLRQGAVRDLRNGESPPPTTATACLCRPACPPLPAHANSTSDSANATLKETLLS